MSRREDYHPAGISSSGGSRLRKENIKPVPNPKYIGSSTPLPTVFAPTKLNDSPISSLSEIRPSTIIKRQTFTLKVPLQQEVHFTQNDWDELHQQFPTATCIQYTYPYIIICGVNPPTEPISIKSLIVEF